LREQAQHFEALSHAGPDEDAAHETAGIEAKTYSV
jgi:hypothetical protein